MFGLNKGKNLKFFYYLRNVCGSLLPNAFYRSRLQRNLHSIEFRDDKAYIHERADYYNKLRRKTPLPESAKLVGDFRLKGHHSTYFFDSYQYVRWFPKKFHWAYVFGDVITVPEVPSVVKSRPLGVDNSNSILLNMDKVRHFVFLNDRIAFKDKVDKVVFRGNIDGKCRRIDFVKKYQNHPMCDVGDIDYHDGCNHVGKMTIHEHLNYKFIMALEGNDVATNLKWVMSSNSIAVMPAPTCETWFMEGTLKPDYHYIEIKADYSDLVEKLDYYIQHPDEAQRIIDHAHEYVRQFQDHKREKLISLLVLDNYFKYTN